MHDYLVFEAFLLATCLIQTSLQQEIGCYIQGECLQSPYTGVNRTETPQQCLSYCQVQYCFFHCGKLAHIHKLNLLIDLWKYFHRILKRVHTSLFTLRANPVLLMKLVWPLAQILAQVAFLGTHPAQTWWEKTCVTNSIIVRNQPTVNTLGMLGSWSLPRDCGRVGLWYYWWSILPSRMQRHQWVQLVLIWLV